MSRLRLLRTLIAALAGAASFTCAAMGPMTMSPMSPYYDPTAPHRGKDGFVNNYFNEPMGKGLVRWNWERLTKGLPKPPANGYRFPADKPDIGWLAMNRSQNAVTWIGHATALVQIGGVNILTDPIFSKRASPVPFIGPERKVPLPLTLAQLPHIDIVMISHNHYDHLDLETVQALNRQAGGPPQFFVPLGVKSFLAEEGVTNVVEMDWWHRAEVLGLTVHFVPAQHWSARGLSDRNQTLWGGWVAQTASAAKKPASFFFAGDTGYSKDFEDIGAKFGGIDLALIPIGAYEPRWFMAPQHIDPAEAVKVHQDIKARRSIGIHWGTFELSDESLDEPPRVLQREAERAGLAPDTFTVMRHGETRLF